MLGLLKNVAGTTNISGTFSAGRRPREVLFSSSRLKCSSSTFCRVLELIQYLSCRLISKNYQSRPPLPEDVPLAHTDSSVPLTSFVLYFLFRLTV